MRIAFSGSHRVGKSSLIERVAERLPRYTVVGEPYDLLEDDGYEHSDPPSVDDFEAQLERSLAALDQDGADVLFDRCPADVLAYLLTHDDAEAFDLEDWLERAREAMQTLDLVVFVPIEDRDRIAVPAHEDRAQRREVDDKLREILVDQRLWFECEVLICEGDLNARAAQVWRKLGVKA